MIINKAIVPAAGLGRRLRPITQVLPKEMFPVGNYPAIQWVIAEAVASGCTEIAVVVSPAKRMIEEYLTTWCPELFRSCRLNFLMQPEPLGLGHVLLMAQAFSDGQPLAVLLPDDLYAGPKLALLQMMEHFATEGGAVFALTEDAQGIAGWSERWYLRRLDDRIYEVQPLPADVLPAAATFPLKGVGRYLFSPESMQHAAILVNQRRAGEFDDGMIFRHMFSVGEPAHGVLVEGRFFDISTPTGYVNAWQCLGNAMPTADGEQFIAKNTGAS